MHKLRAYLQIQLQPFDRGALWSPQILKKGSSVIACWAIPAFVIVCLVDRYREYLPSAYLEAAISEGIGPHLWNVIGTLALVLVGLAFLFPRSKLVAISAYQVLINTHAIGGLSFGLLFGQLATALVSASANVAAWKAWLMGAGSVFLATQALLLNFSLWYLGWAFNGFTRAKRRLSSSFRTGFFAAQSGRIHTVCGTAHRTTIHGTVNA
jgi:hypothetical protein